MKAPNRLLSQTSKEEEKTISCGFDPTLENLMQLYDFTGDVEALKEFILRGGDIHKYNLGEVVVKLMGKNLFPNSGGAKPAEMITFYIEVEVARTKPALRDKKWRIKQKGTDNKLKTPEEKLTNFFAVLKTKTSKVDAIESISKANGLTYDGGKYRYNKGQSLFKKRFKRGWN